MVGICEVEADRITARGARRAAVICALVALAAAGSTDASAGPVANGTEVMGSVYAARAIGTTHWCSIDRGSSHYRRDSTTAVAIDLPDMALMRIATNDYRHWSGVGRLKFTAAQSGTIGFDLPANWPNDLRSLPFDNYAEAWNAAAKSLTVSFRVSFPGCKLPIVTRLAVP